jgi:hypothetical protein
MAGDTSTWYTSGARRSIVLAAATSLREATGLHLAPSGMSPMSAPEVTNKRSLRSRDRRSVLSRVLCSTPLSGFFLQSGLCHDAPPIRSAFAERRHNVYTLPAEWQ